MTDASHPRPGHKVLALVDLAGYAKAFAEHDDASMAAFTQAYYALCADVLEEAGGRIVKFIGDACLAVFPVDDATAAVAAVCALESQVAALARRESVAVAMGANVHVGEVMEGLFGPDAHARYDIIGSAMNDTALMGQGPVVRVSGTLRDMLPEGEQLRWKPSEDVEPSEKRFRENGVFVRK